MHPFYQVHNKTDEQLQDEMTRLLSQRSHAASKNMWDLVDNIEMMMNTIHDERESRKIREQLASEETTQVIELGTIEPIGERNDNSNTN